MSTRSSIARMTPTGFTGVYHHWDGYPRGLGAHLFELYRTDFKRDLNALLKHCIDDHPAGWSTIMPGERTKPEPECYCHSKSRDEAWSVNQSNASGSGCEYAYVFTNADGKDMMFVLSSFCGDRKMIGMFGHGAPDAEWKPIGIVDLNGEEPDWDQMEADQTR